MHFKFYFYIIFLSLITRYSVPLQAASTQESLSYINKIRVSSGLIPLKKNIFLKKAAYAHAKYIIYNQTSGHFEKRGKRGYTGRTADQRVRYAGYGSRFTMENISINARTQFRSIDILFSAIYHRFVFLNLEQDEIGIGMFKTTKKHRIFHAYVYELGASTVVDMCKHHYTIKPNAYYAKHICKKDTTMVPWKIAEIYKNQIRQKNASIVLYPYAGQKEVNPAFYNESPDPLPGYKVSGYPISVQFNKAIYKHIKLQTFRLFTEDGKEIKKVRLLDKQRDRNHHLSAYEYALMPLERLDYNKRYVVWFGAIADGKKIVKKWSFKTKTFKQKYFTLTKRNTTIKVKKGETVILYSKPTSKKDILRYYKTRGKLKISFIDPNTLKVTFPIHTHSKKATLELSNRKKIFFKL
jgi:uncharacterized protein YkwD